MPEPIIKDMKRHAMGTKPFKCNEKQPPPGNSLLLSEILFTDKNHEWRK